MNMRSVVMAAITAFGLASLPAVADTATVATLAQVSGKVMVNQGKGFTMAKAGMSLGENARLITLDDATASVVYADGCVGNVKPNSVLAISSNMGCKAQAASVHGTTPAAMRYAQTTPTNDAGNGGAAPIVTGTTVAGVIGGTILLCVGNVLCDDDKNVSGQ